jgi:ABC-type glycerol-3-phosphate transport system substrate-binding protein
MRYRIADCRLRIADWRSGFGFILGICLLALLGPGCGGVIGSTNENEITIWETYANEEHEIFVEIKDDFEKWYKETYGKDVHVNVQRLPFADHVQKIKFAAITGTAPDIVRVDAGELIDLAYGQAVLDIRTIDPDIDSFLSTFTQPARESVKIPIRQANNTLREGVFGIPDQITGVAVYYNRRMFREKNIPFPPSTLAEMEKSSPRWTFERFHEVAQSLSDEKAGQYGLALNSSLWFSLPIFNAFGANFVEFSSDGMARCTLASDSGVRALTALTSTYWSKAEAGAWLPGALGADRGFINQKYAMIISGPWNLQQFANAGVDFGVALIPEGPNVQTIRTLTNTHRVGTSTNVGGTDMAIIKSSRKAELSLAFLKYFTSAPVYAKWCNKLGQIPVQTLSEPLVDFSKNPALVTFMDQMRTAIPRPKIPRYGVLEGQIMVPQIERAFRSGNVQGVRESLEQAAAEIDRQILADVNIAR